MGYTSLQRTIEELEVIGLGLVRQKIEDGENEFYIRVSDTSAVGTVRHLLYSLMYHMGATRLYRIKVRGTEMQVKRKSGVELSMTGENEYRLPARGIKGTAVLSEQMAKVPTEAESDAETADFMDMVDGKNL